MKTTLPQPLVSVIIPAYNCTKYLPECMDSLFRQTLRDIEIIIVDDRSSDNGATAQMEKEFAEADDRVKIFVNKTNSGPGVARDYGLQFAAGKYIFFIDSDDTIYPDTLQQLVDLAEAHNADAVRCAWEIHSASGNVLDKKSHARPRIFTRREELDKIALMALSTNIYPEDAKYDVGASCWALLIRADKMLPPGQNFPQTPFFLSEDYAFCYTIMRHINKLVFLPDTLYKYREVPTSRTNEYRTDMIRRSVDTAKYFEEMVRKDFGDDNSFAINHARGYVVMSLRGYIKRMFMTNLSLSQKKKWMLEQRDLPIMDQLERTFPWRQLPFKHRIGFQSFMKRRFMLLYSLIVGQERLRSLLGRN